MKAYCHIHGEMEEASMLIGNSAYLKFECGNRRLAEEYEMDAWERRQEKSGGEL